VKTAATIAAILFAALPSVATVRAAVTPRDLATAINKAEAQLVPYRRGNIRPDDIRTVHCIASDEEPTEFQCKWQLRIRGSWVKRTTWLVIDGNGWRVMDA